MTVESQIVQEEKNKEKQRKKKQRKRKAEKLILSKLPRRNALKFVEYGFDICVERTLNGLIGLIL